MAFTTLTLFQIFNVPNARSEESGAFSGLFRNRWLWGALLLSVLQLLVVYVPFLQLAFGTVGLSIRDCILCVSIASSVLWQHEISKLLSPSIARSVIG